MEIAELLKDEVMGQELKQKYLVIFIEE